MHASQNPPDASFPKMLLCNYSLGELSLKMLEMDEKFFRLTRFKDIID